jgi:hypothetical protein
MGREREYNGNWERFLTHFVGGKERFLKINATSNLS